jgi:DHA1 family bicyclomycin/chloramphenicol resistance-like MFS transporter
MCSPGAAAGAIAPFPRLAGTAAAALGALQTGSAAIVGFMVGRLHDDTGLPMALTIAGLAIAGVAAFRLLTVPDRLEPGPGA